MKKVLYTLAVIVALSGVWGTARFTAFMQGIGLQPIAKRGDTEDFTQRVTALIDEQSRGNAAMVILNDGQVVAEHTVSKGAPVSADTVFGVASVSKWVTALGVMVLAEQGKLALDVPVSRYLTRWSLPHSEFDNELVTVRRLLSHTAGMGDGLGHNGFAPGEAVQPLEEHLTQALDADPGVSGKVAVTAQPGSSWHYSGGSYNLIQLIIEEVSGQSFADFMQANVFAPLNMQSTYFQVNRQDPNLAEYFGENGALRAYPNYTSLAATGLYTSVNDMIKLVSSNFDKQHRRADLPPFLNDSSLAEMRQPVASVGGMDIWGSGVMLFAQSDNGFVQGHGGKSPFLNATVRYEPVTGQAFIMFQTGNEEAFASDMATQWTLWLTGKPDMYMVNSHIGGVFSEIFIGILVIALFVSGTVIWQSRRRATLMPA